MKELDTAISKAIDEYAKYMSLSKSKDLFVLINMRQPSNEKRLYVGEVSSRHILQRHFVAHGVNSSDPNNRAIAVSFSNVIGSNKSCLGAMKTGAIYQGKHGKSLRIYGLEKSKNGNSLVRGIVFHAADYMKPSYITANGRAGQSHGCPALDPAISSNLIDLIKEGVFVYVYY